MIDLESSDAGALLRFADVYSRMDGGQMSTVMDPPSATNPAQLGRLSVRNFTVHDESQLEQRGIQWQPAAAQQHVLLGIEGRFYPLGGARRAA